MALEGFQSKTRFIADFRQQVVRHRREDLDQLREARQEAARRWEERFGRFAEWSASAAAQRQVASGLLAWKEGAVWLDRAQGVGLRYAGHLERKAERLGSQALAAAARLRRWADRLILKEGELRDFLNRQTVQTAEILVSSARKRPYQDFLFLEREEEGKLTLELRAIGAASARALKSLSRSLEASAGKAGAGSAQFEISRNQILEAWRPVQQRFAKLYEENAAQGLLLDEGHARLRWMYETVQKMRVVEEAAPPSRPLLHRLFGIGAGDE
jgi:hypothetical protein